MRNQKPPKLKRKPLIKEIFAVAHANQTDGSTDNISDDLLNDTTCDAQFEYKLGYSDLLPVATARVPWRRAIHAKLEIGGSNVNKKKIPTNRTLSTPDKASISLRTSKVSSSAKEGFKVNVRFIFLLIQNSPENLFSESILKLYTEVCS